MGRAKLWHHLVRQHRPRHVDCVPVCQHGRVDSHPLLGEPIYYKPFLSKIVKSQAQNNGNSSKLKAIIVLKKLKAIFNCIKSSQEQALAKKLCMTWIMRPFSLHIIILKKLFATSISDQWRHRKCLQLGIFHPSYCCREFFHVEPRSWCTERVSNVFLTHFTHYSSNFSIRDFENNLCFC